MSIIGSTTAPNVAKQEYFRNAVPTPGTVKETVAKQPIPLVTEVETFTMTDTFSSRETANGRKIVSNSYASVKTVVGDTVKTSNLYNPANVRTSDSQNCTEVEWLNNYYAVIASGKSDNTSIGNWNNGWVCPGLSVSDALGDGIALKAGDTVYISADITLIEQGPLAASIGNRLYASKNSVVLQGGEKIISTTKTRYTWIYTIATDSSSYYPVFTLSSNKVKIENITVSLDEAKPFTTYFAGLKNASFAGIESTCRNLIPFPYYLKSGTTQRGVTLTYDENGVINLSGTNDSGQSISFALTDNARTWIKLKAGTYKYSQSISYNICYGIIQVRTATGSFVTNISARSEASSVITIPQEYEDNGYQYNFILVVMKDADVDGVVVKLMFNHGNVAFPFAPYTMSTLDFPKTELAEWDKIDFEGQKIVKGTRTIVFNGTENWRIGGTDTTSTTGERRVIIYPQDIVKNENVEFAGFVKCNQYDTISARDTYSKQNGVSTYLSELEIYDEKFNTNDISLWKAHLAELYASGNPLTVAYKLATDTEEEFTHSNEYKVYDGGTETVINENASYGAINALTIEYVENYIGEIVVKQTDYNSYNKECSAKTLQNGIRACKVYGEE